MAQIKIHRDGSVETLCGTQDIGGGARTVVQLHTSRLLKYLPLGKITVRIGDSSYGSSGASAGSSTTRGVEWEVKRAVSSVLKTLFEEVASKLDADVSGLELLEGGKIRAAQTTLILGGGVRTPSGHHHEPCFPGGRPGFTVGGYR